MIIWVNKETLRESPFMALALSKRAKKQLGQDDSSGGSNPYSYSRSYYDANKIPSNLRYLTSEYKVLNRYLRDYCADLEDAKGRRIVINKMEHFIILEKAVIGLTVLIPDSLRKQLDNSTIVRNWKSGKYNILLKAIKNITPQLLEIAVGFVISSSPLKKYLR